jgi:hypothetical protein
MIERNSNFHFLWLLLGLLSVSIANCGSTTIGGSTTMSRITPQSISQGTLHGTVTASPVCPVETPDDVCRPRPLANQQVQIKGPDGISITITTDQQGTFSLQLPAGRYLVEVQPVSYPMRQRTPLTAVFVTAGQVTDINIPLDTGIR